MHIHAAFNGLIYVVFKGNGLIAAIGNVCGDDDVRLAVNDTFFQAFGRKSAKNNGVNGADTRAGQHRIGGFGYHWHVNGDAIAFFDATFFQCIGKFAHFVFQLSVTYFVGFFGVIALEYQGGGG